MFFTICLLVMLVAAINYQNNMSFALTFLLANLFVVAVLHSYANLSGLEITGLGAREVFAGTPAAFALRLSARGKSGHYALRVALPAPAQQRVASAWWRRLFAARSLENTQDISVLGGEQQVLRVFVPAQSRGRLRPGRILIESEYPLGLIRCWTWIDLDMQALVYPAPIAAGEPVGYGGEDLEGRILTSGNEEFFGIRSFRQGDSPRRVYWKAVARGQEMQSKDFASLTRESRWLQWDDFVGLAQEARLSALCFWVLDYHRRDMEFGLKIPGFELSPGSGDRHRDRALHALALFGLPGEEGP
ncbi:MAG: DUF58 domain-containing protein [Congregibacter sp.]